MSAHSFCGDHVLTILIPRDLVSAPTTCWKRGVLLGDTGVILGDSDLRLKRAERLFAFRSLCLAADSCSSASRWEQVFLRAGVEEEPRGVRVSSTPAGGWLPCPPCVLSPPQLVALSFLRMSPYAVLSLRLHKAAHFSSDGDRLNWGPCFSYSL